MVSRRPFLMGSVLGLFSFPRKVFANDGWARMSHHTSLPIVAARAALLGHPREANAACELSPSVRIAATGDGQSHFQIRAEADGQVLVSAKYDLAVSPDGMVISAEMFLDAPEIRRLNPDYDWVRGHEAKFTIRHLEKLLTQAELLASQAGQSTSEITVPSDAPGNFGVAYLVASVGLLVGAAPGFN